MCPGPCWAEGPPRHHPLPAEPGLGPHRGPGGPTAAWCEEQCEGPGLTTGPDGRLQHGTHSRRLLHTHTDEHTPCALFRFNFCVLLIIVIVFNMVSWSHCQVAKSLLELKDDDLAVQIDAPDTLWGETGTVHFPFVCIIMLCIIMFSVFCCLFSLPLERWLAFVFTKQRSFVVIHFPVSLSGGLHLPTVRLMFAVA